MAAKSQIVGFGGFKPRYSGSIHDDPVVRAARAGRTVEEILADDQASPSRPKFDTTNVNSEYGFRYQNMKLDKASPRTPEKFDPWDLENRVQAELDLPRTKIDLSKGAIPNYGGYIPGLKYRFGESYAALSTQAK